MTTRISEHFTREEIACKCGCGFDTMDAKTLEVAEFVRWLLNAPITPNSGCRCPAYDKSIRSPAEQENYKPTSQHTKARAMDLPMPSPEAGVAVYNALREQYPNRYAFGLYDTFIHIDTRSGHARRWDKRIPRA